MAELVSEGALSLDSSSGQLLPYEKAKPSDLLWCDGLAVGSPTYAGLMTGRLKLLFGELVAEVLGKVEGELACAFSSTGGRGDGAELTCLAILSMLLNFGFLVFGVPAYTGSEQTLHYRAEAIGSSQAGAGEEGCRRLGRRLAEYCALLLYGQSEAHPQKQPYRR